MPAIDFATAYVTWTPLPSPRYPAGGLIARGRIHPACTLHDEATGAIRTHWTSERDNRERHAHGEVLDTIAERHEILAPAPV